MPESTSPTTVEQLEQRLKRLEQRFVFIEDLSFRDKATKEDIRLAKLMLRDEMMYMHHDLTKQIAGVHQPKASVPGKRRAIIKR